MLCKLFFMCAVGFQYSAKSKMECQIELWINTTGMQISVFKFQPKFIYDGKMVSKLMPCIDSLWRAYVVWVAHFVGDFFLKFDKCVLFLFIVT